MMQPSLSAFLENLPKTKANRQYFTNIMYARTVNNDLNDENRELLPNNILETLAPKKLIFWHTIVKYEYSLFDIDLTELDFATIEIIDNDRRGDILLNPTLMPEYRAMIGIIENVGCSYIERAELIDAIGVEDTLKILHIDNIFGGSLTYSYGQTEPYSRIQIQFVRDLIDYIIANPEGSIKITDLSHTFQEYYLIATQPDDLILPSITNIKIGDYKIDACLPVSGKFTVDRKAPEYLLKHPHGRILLPLFAKTPSDDIVDSLSIHQKYITFEHIQSIIDRRNDIQFECVYNDDDSDGSDDDRPIIIGIDVYGPNSHVHIDIEPETDLESFYDHPVYMYELTFNDIKKIHIVDKTVNLVLKLTDDDIFSSHGVFLSNEHWYVKKCPSGNYYSENLEHAHCEAYMHVQHHRDAIRFILNYHRNITILKNHFITGVSDIIVSYYAGPKCLVLYPYESLECKKECREFICPKSV